MGLIRLTDMGHTLLHLSYENDLDKFRTSTRGDLLESIKAEFNVKEDSGAFYLDTSIDKIGNDIFRLGQALTKINDLTFLNRSKTDSTFYEELEAILYKLVDGEKIVKDYFYDGMENSQNYPIDYKIDGKNAPIFLFGIPNKDKARLTTITLERLNCLSVDFESILVFSDMGALPKSDFARIMNIGGEMISSLEAENDLNRKLARKISLN